MIVALVNQAPISSGVGRCAFETHRRMAEHGGSIDHLYLHYGQREIQLINNTGSTSIARLRRIPEDKYVFYYRCQSRIPRYDIYHLANQNLSFLKLKPKVVTCYDLIQYLYPVTPFHRLHAKITHSGLKDASKIITISEFTKLQIVEYLRCQEDKITVIYEGIDHALYKPVSEKDNSILERYGIPRNHKLILYVGSEQPRKNLPVLIKALHKLKTNIKDVKLVKVGEAGAGGERGVISRLIRQLNLEADVIFTGRVSEEDLPKLYNLVDVYVSPTLYEGGFALPVLEAMACGCPAITSNIPPLVETVSDGGILVDPKDINGLAASMYEVLTNNSLRQDMISKGIKRASIFSWDKAATETLKVYEEVGGEL
jgi:glycosyltransferase involved in cell wall biosynthesis